MAGRVRNRTFLLATRRTEIHEMRKKICAEAVSKGGAIQMKYRPVCMVLVALGSMLALAAPASAAPPAPPVQLTCEVVNHVPEGELSECGYEWVLDAGGDVHLVLANQCWGLSKCWEDVTLLGSWDRVVIERANECGNQAICRITVNTSQAQIKSLQIRDKTISAFDTIFRNRCDSTAICSKTP